MKRSKKKSRSPARRLATILLAVLAALITVLLLTELALQGAAWFALRARGDPGSGSGAITVLCVGDSWTYGDGSGDPARLSYPAQLKALLDARLGKGRYRVVNEGRPGATTAEILPLLPRMVRKYKPSIVVLLSGGTTFVDRWNATRGLGSGRFGMLARLKVVQIAQLLMRPQIYRQNRSAHDYSRELLRTFNTLMTNAAATREDRQGHPLRPVQGCSQGEAVRGKLKALGAGATPQKYSAGLQLLLAHEPGCAAYQVAAAEHGLRQKRRQVAEAHAHRALRIAPWDPRAMVALAVSTGSLEGKKSAFKLLERVVKEHPRYLRAQRLLVLAGIHWRPDFCNAMFVLSEVLEANPDCKWARAATTCLETALVKPAGRQVVKEIHDKMRDDIAGMARFFRQRKIKLLVINYPRHGIEQCRG